MEWSWLHLVQIYTHHSPILHFHLYYHFQLRYETETDKIKRGRLPFFLGRGSYHVSSEYNYINPVSGRIRILIWYMAPWQAKPQINKRRLISMHRLLNLAFKSGPWILANLLDHQTSGHQLLDIIANAKPSSVANPQLVSCQLLDPIAFKASALTNPLTKPFRTAIGSSHLLACS